MNIQILDAEWLSERSLCSIEHLTQVSGLSVEEIEDLIVSGLIHAAHPLSQPPIFQLTHVVTVRQARRLRDDFQLDRNGLALAMTLLRRIAALEEELRGVPSQISHHKTGE